MWILLAHSSITEIPKQANFTVDTTREASSSVGVNIHYGDFVGLVEGSLSIKPDHLSPSRKVKEILA